jgi:hypothetical protein
MVAFTDESIRRLRHTPTPQRHRDPQLARHFLVVGPHSKTFFVQVERPKEHPSPCSGSCVQIAGSLRLPVLESHADS